MKNILLIYIIFVWLITKPFIANSFAVVDSCNHYLEGTIIDGETGKHIPFATISVGNTEKGVVANNLGKFVLGNLCESNYTLIISAVGYQKKEIRVEIPLDSELQLRLKTKKVVLKEVVVADNREQRIMKEESLTIDVVDKDFLKQNQGGSLMQSLDKLGGVSTMSIGSGQSKPVIRGLGFNRVVVVENGIKHEGQQWGIDHGLEIDQYAVSNIEVIKGPASLSYGSDAIGGVIDIKQNNLPEKNTLSGTVDFTGKTNNDLLGTSFQLAGRGEHFFGTLRATLLDYADYKVTTDSVDIYNYRAALHKNNLRNTAGNERNLHLSIGYVNQLFQSRFYISNIYSKSGFFANAHGIKPVAVDEEFHDRSSRDIQYPFQNVNHFKIINKSQWSNNNFSMEVDLGFQRNFRQEWSQYVSHGFMPSTYEGGEGFKPELERQFDKHIYSANLDGTYFYSNNTSFNFGLTGDYQENDINGRGFIIPAFERINIGSFFIAKRKLSAKQNITAGARYDYGNIKIESYQDWFPSEVVNGTDTSEVIIERASDSERNFSSFSWALGYNYNAENWTLKTNIGKSFRMPIAKELGANGVDYHRFSYAVGDADLSPEISYQIDAGLIFDNKTYNFSITPFANYFTNYIYLNPTALMDRLYGNGNQKFNYIECKVFRYGGEISAAYNITKELIFNLIGEYVYSRQLSGEKKGYTLPFSPPSSIVLGGKYKKDVNFLKNVYLSVDYKIASAQRRLVPPEVVTQGYQLVNLGMGGEIGLKDKDISISLQVQNLFNTKYFDHTSFYRIINVPETGRNFILNLSIPFSIKQ